MTEIEQKALALLNEVQEFDCGVSIYHVHNGKLLRQALCRAIEKREADKAAHAATIEGILKAHEAYKQDVSDAVQTWVDGGIDRPAWIWFRKNLERFIISKPDPLVEALNEMPNVCEDEMDKLIAQDADLLEKTSPLSNKRDGSCTCALIKRREAFDAHDAAQLREALAKRGLKIVEDV